MSAAMANLSIRNVSVTYPSQMMGGAVTALKDVNLEIESGDFVVALGDYTPFVTSGFADEAAKTVK